MKLAGRRTLKSLLFTGAALMIPSPAAPPGSKHCTVCLPVLLITAGGGS
jgi:hypothetical protein